MNLEEATIAVTGATGFLGGYLISALSRHGARPVAVVRSPSKAAPLGKRGVEIRTADLTDRAALAAAFRGVHAVIANAGLISFTNPKAAFETNVEGTRNTFLAMRDAGVTRAIAISSTAVYRPSLRVRGESARLRNGRRLAVNAYGASKAAAEQVAWELSGRHGISLTAFRPCGITAPDDPLLMGTLRKITAWPVTVLPVFTQVGVVHAADVAEAVCQALSRPHVAHGKAYNLQGETVSLWGLTDRYLRTRGAGPRLRLPLPLPVQLRYDDGLARRELGFAPRTVDAICAEAVASR